MCCGEPGSGDVVNGQMAPVPFRAKFGDILPPLMSPLLCGSAAICGSCGWYRHRRSGDFEFGGHHPCEFFVVVFAVEGVAHVTEAAAHGSESPSVSAPTFAKVPLGVCETNLIIECS